MTEKIFHSLIISKLNLTILTERVALAHVGVVVGAHLGHEALYLGCDGYHVLAHLCIVGEGGAAEVDKLAANPDEAAGYEGKDKGVAYDLLLFLVHIVDDVCSIFFLVVIGS